MNALWIRRARQAPAARRLRQLRTHPAGKRAYRTVLALVTVFIIHAYDLAMTHSQLDQPRFTEANQVAASIIGTAPGLTQMAAYKMILLGFGAYILYRFRQRWLSEAAAWTLAACAIVLVGWWKLYLDAIEITLRDPVVNFCTVPG